MTDVSEEWRSIPGWEGLYEASSLGRVRSLSRMVTFLNRRGTTVRRWLTGRVMQPATSKAGYYGVMLSGGEGAVHREVQILVCAAFHGPRPDGMQAAHRNGVSTDNSQGNLRWATPRENAGDKVDHGTLKFGEAHYAARLSAGAVTEIRDPRHTARSLAEKFGISPKTVSKIRKRRAWKQVA